MDTLDQAQQDAVAACCDTTKRLVSVTGEAGTGKTTIIRNVAQRLMNNKTSFALAAPTGKAARRIREATGFPASTVHKLLGFNRPELDEKTGKVVTESRPYHTSMQPLEFDVILVDEYAMVNTELHAYLVNALKQGSCLRVFGDRRQLPPIEAYKVDPSYVSPFNKCLDRPNSHILNKVYRQGEGSGILDVARHIVRGVPFPRNDEVSFTLSDMMVKKMLDFVKTAPDKWRTLSHQIISPGRISDIGTMKLNTSLQSILNATGSKLLKLPRHDWDKNNVAIAVGDKVVCNQNCYDLRDYFDRFTVWIDDLTPEISSYIQPPESKVMLNGEVGIVDRISEEGDLEINFGDRIVEIPHAINEYWAKKNQIIVADNRKNVELAYALTTHKCQGSEFEEIAYVMGRSVHFNLSKPNFYTAVTRAKKHVHIFTDAMAYSKSLKVG